MQKSKEEMLKEDVESNLAGTTYSEGEKQAYRNGAEFGYDIGVLDAESELQLKHTFDVEGYPGRELMSQGVKFVFLQHHNDLIRRREDEIKLLRAKLSYLRKKKVDEMVSSGSISDFAIDCTMEKYDTELNAITLAEE